jgi:hypothetical protein
MTVTSSGLFKAAGAAAVVSGALFIVVQIGHPGAAEFTTQTTQWVARSFIKLVMAGLALAGITGIYLRQYRRAGVLGLVGYVLFAIGYLAMFATEVVAATVLPGLTRSNPAFVNDAIAAATGGKADGDIGNLPTLFALAGIGFLLGGLVFGIATYRAGVMARWAAALLAVSTLGTAALAVLPESFNRPLAVPTGIAFIGLGLSVWKHSHSTQDDMATSGDPRRPLVSGRV